MNRRVIASAPGKLVIVGEYAVLYGAPALVTAVSQRASVSLMRRDDDLWRVTAPGLRGDLTSSALEFSGSTDPALNSDLPLLGSVLKSLNYQGQGQTAELNTQAFFSASDRQLAGATAAVRSKLGLGSSAALCTALVAAVAQVQIHDSNNPPDDSARAKIPVDLASVLAAHRAFQDGRGSGIDVAASYLGGCQQFQIDSLSPAGVVHLSLPLPLPMVWVWSGKSAATTARLDTLRRFQQTQPRHFTDAMTSLTALSRAACDAALAQNPADFLQATKDFTQVLNNLDQRIELGVWTDEHHQLAAIAQTFGVAYKTSGAGGGDCGLAMDIDPEKLESFYCKAVAEGFFGGKLASENTGLTLK